MNKISKVIIPVAGKGTRLLPITKTISKTMLPVIDKPVIQYLLEEAVLANIEEAVIVIGPNQLDIKDYFDLNSAYVKNLGVTNGDLNALEKLIKSIKLTFVVQEEPLGLGHAVLLAEEAIGKNPFGLILGDNLVLGDGLIGIYDLIECYNHHPANYIGIKEVLLEDTKKYGILKFAEGTKVIGIIEKPQANPPSLSACIGRYVFNYTIFDYLKKIKRGLNGEYLLTDAIMTSIQNEEVFGMTFNGEVFDTGDKFEYALAIATSAIYNNTYKERFINELRRIIENGKQS